MLRTSMQTLKHIFVTTRVNNYNDDPLFRILSEFEDMRTKNIIETVTIEVLYGSYYRVDDWSRLDEVLTIPGWFALKRVLLAIHIASCVGREALQKLLETRFPRLSSSNSVSFDFKIDDQIYNVKDNTINDLEIGQKDSRR
jgi:hypothetical protein